MEILSLILRAALLKKQLREKPCPRCGLLYDPGEQACPHCGGLSEAELARLLETKAEEREGNAALGWMLLFGAALLAGLLVVFAAAG